MTETKVKIKRGKKFKKYLGCEVIWINPDRKDFDIYVEISKNIQPHY